MLFTYQSWYPLFTAYGSVFAFAGLFVGFPIALLAIFATVPASV